MQNLYCIIILYRQVISERACIQCQYLDTYVEPSRLFSKVKYHKDEITCHLIVMESLRIAGLFVAY